MSRTGKKATEAAVTCTGWLNRIPEREHSEGRFKKGALKYLVAPVTGFRRRDIFHRTSLLFSIFPLIPFLLLVMAFSPVPVSAWDFAFITTTDYSTGSSSVIWMSEPYSVDRDVASIYSDAVSRYFDGLVYVVNRYGGDNIQVLDPSGGFSTVRQFSVGSGSDPHDIAFASATKAYVTRYNTTELWIVDPTTGAHTGTIDMSGFADGDGIPEMDKMLAVGDRLFISIQRLDRDNWWLPAGPGIIAVVDMTADTLIDVDPSEEGRQSIVLSSSNPYSDIQFDPFSGKIFISCVGTWGIADGGVEIVDPDNMTVEGFMIGESAAGGDINDVEVVSAEKGYLIVTDADFYNVLKSFNPSTGEVGEVLYAPQAYTLSDIEVSPSKKLFLCDRSATKPGVRIYSTYTDSEETNEPIDVGLPPFQITFSCPVQTGDETPASALLGQNYPNPFNPSTTIPFSISRESAVTVDIFDCSGRHIKNLLRGHLPAASYELHWDGRDSTGRRVASGVYFVRMRAAGVAFSKKIVLLR